MSRPVASEDSACSSLGDDERVHRLFQACDGDGDGFIDCEDLESICRALGLVGPLQPLLMGLGADERGRVSVHEFTARQQALRPQIDALRGREDNIGDQQDNWGWVSGVGRRGLSHERSPNEHRSPSTMLDIANKLHVAAITALKTEVLELTARMQALGRERDHLQVRLGEEQSERVRAQVRLESAGAAHEARLTELHCVIAELSRKLQHQQQQAIVEENERELSELETSSICELEEIERTISDLTETEHGEEETGVVTPESPAELPRPELTSSVNQSANTHCLSATHIASLQEEVLGLRQEVAHLYAQLSSKNNSDSVCNGCVDDSICNQDYDTESAKKSNSCTSEQDYDDGLPNNLRCRFNGSKNCSENDENVDSDRHNQSNEFLVNKADISNDVDHQNRRNTSINRIGSETDLICDKSEERVRSDRHSVAKHIKTSSLIMKPARSLSPIHVHGSFGRTGHDGSGTPVAKMAERVKLRRTAEDKHITGPDITNTGVCTTEVAEHLVSDLLTESTLRESLGVNFLVKNDTVQGETMRLGMELERSHARLEHSRTQNTVLALTLQENKVHCDRLALLCGRYESNAIALQVALNFSDRTVEAYDVLLALLESQLGILSAVEDDQLISAQDSRRTAETVAKHLLARLQDEGGSLGASTGPWHDAISLYSNSAVNADPWSPADETRLRALMSRLKVERAGVQGTVVILESPYTIGELDIRNKINSQEIKRLDLETAILMQELMSTREEKTELRARVFSMERDKVETEKRLCSMEDAHRTAQAALEHLQGQLADTKALIDLARLNKSAARRNINHLYEDLSSNS